MAMMFESQKPLRHRRFEKNDFQRDNQAFAAQKKNVYVMPLWLAPPRFSEDANPLPGENISDQKSRESLNADPAVPLPWRSHGPKPHAREAIQRDSKPPRCCRTRSRRDLEQVGVISDR